MADLTLRKVNDIYGAIDCENSIAKELSEYFSFYVKDYQFIPAYRNKFWDGKKYLFKAKERLLYLGLYRHLELFCKERGYSYEFVGIEHIDIQVSEFNQFIIDLKLPKEFQLMKHQYTTIWDAIADTRGLWLSPTSSGKSLMIYAIARYFGLKTLIITPSTGLIHQLTTDLADYGYQGVVHKMFAEQERYSDNLITISTWQSAIKQDEAWLNQYGCVIVDEAHLANAKSITTILENMPDCKYRYGFTGTLDGTETHKLVLEGLFGPCKVATTTHQLMEEGIVAKLNIECIVLKYPDSIRKLVSAMKFHEEMDFIVRNKTRNEFIKKLCFTLKGNTLLLFQFVDKHGEILYDLMKDSGRDVYFIHGGVEGVDRDKIRAIIEKSKDAIVIASYGTFSTGVSIKNLHSVVFASSYKARIKNLQSIGRGLRVSDTKKSVRLFDIADDFSWKKKTNYTLKHFIERIKIYSGERFEYTIRNLELK